VTRRLGSGFLVLAIVLGFARVVGSISTRDQAVGLLPHKLVAPPPGAIWFGQPYDPASFNPATFVLSDLASSFPVGHAIGLQATYAFGVSGQDILVYATIGSVQRLIDNIGLSAVGDSGMADVVPAWVLADPGSISFAVKDSKGNVLASGAITVH
jgi:hypothetical protein